MSETIGGSSEYETMSLINKKIKSRKANSQMRRNLSQ